jgi:hypothetical protein
MAVLNNGVPLDRWLDLAASDDVAPERRRHLAGVGLVRSIVDGRDDLTPKLAALLLAADPALAPDLQPYVDAKDADEKAFLVTLFLLRHSELDYELRGPYATLDWWCGGASPYRPAAMDYRPRFLALDAPMTHRLPESIAAELLGRRVFAYADAHPRDERVPEALYRIVRVTRYGCGRGEPANKRISQAAFQRLHQRYAASRWTKETPYWFE